MSHIPHGAYALVRPKGGGPVHLARLYSDREEMADLIAEDPEAWVPTEHWQYFGVEHTDRPEAVEVVARVSLIAHAPDGSVSILTAEGFGDRLVLP